MYQNSGKYHIIILPDLDIYTPHIPERIGYFFPGPIGYLCVYVIEVTLPVNINVYAEQIHQKKKSFFAAQHAMNKRLTWLNYFWFSVRWSNSRYQLVGFTEQTKHQYCTCISPDKFSRAYVIFSPSTCITQLQLNSAWYCRCMNLFPVDSVRNKPNPSLRLRLFQRWRHLENDSSYPLDNHLSWRKRSFHLTFQSMEKEPGLRPMLFDFIHHVISSSISCHFTNRFQDISNP